MSSDNDIVGSLVAWGAVLGSYAFAEYAGVHSGYELFALVVVSGSVGLCLTTFGLDWLRCQKACEHGVRAGSRRCRICLAEADRIKREHESAAAKWAQMEERRRAAKLLRQQEIERLSKAWLSNTESYFAMTARQFEGAIAELFRKLGYKVTQTPFSNDGGKDAIAQKHGKKYLIECKRYAADKAIGRRDIQILVAAMQDENADEGFYINTGVFTGTAKKYAEANRILLYDRLRLPLLVNQAYPTPIDMSNANVMCIECGAVASMPVASEPTTRICINGHSIISNIVKADLRIFSSAGILSCDRCGSPMRKVNSYRGQFWGCTRFPNCRATKSIATKDVVSVGSLPLFRTRK